VRSSNHDKKIRLDTVVSEKDFLALPGSRAASHPVWRGLKRAGDVLFSSLGLAVSLPLWPLVAAAVKLGSKGPVFYVQDRIGRGGKPFSLIKFRSMVEDAENGDPVWAKIDDVRITPVGRILRRIHLDEWPQLWNVLRGDMSLVGPRPERPGFVEELTDQIPFYGLRHAVKPGLTGWAQVNYKYAASLKSSRVKLEYDLYYIARWSPVLDAGILVRTIGKVFEKESVE
jgi:lipopolysaccharide/colanic/teichoic acid biosynthesis glycosyltransferase